MQMKLMLPSHWSHDAKLLILDEPTTRWLAATNFTWIILHAYIEDSEHSVLFSTISLPTSNVLLASLPTSPMAVYTGPKDEFEVFRLIKGGPDELAQLPADVVLLTYVCHRIRCAGPVRQA